MTSGAKVSAGASHARLICVGVITRGRPQMLELLLRSLARLDRTGLNCCFAIVENDGQLTITEIVKSFQADVAGCRVMLENEPRLGIASARNHALDIALRVNADVLAFIDDDETADPMWLKNLVSEMNRRNLDLVGGPVRLHPAPDGISLRPRTVWRGLNAIALRQEQTASAEHARGCDNRLALATNNWLANISFLHEHQLRFDKNLGFSGGEDTALFVTAKVQGARTGWAPEAIVHEWMPPSRLTFAYQYARSRDRAMSAFHGKYPQPSMATTARAVASSLAKLAGALVYTVRSLSDGGASLVAAVQAVGFASGRVKAALGARSQHYRDDNSPK